LGKTAECIAIPENAIFDKTKNEAFVFIVQGETVAKKKVTLGALMGKEDGNKSEEKSGKKAVKKTGDKTGDKTSDKSGNKTEELREIVEGLNKGELVITRPVQGLEEGINVQDVN
jgi:hypothetical protein